MLEQILASNKKGSILDVITIVTFLLILAPIIVGIFIGYTSLNDGLTDYTSTLEDSQLKDNFERSGEIIDNQTTSYSNIWDFLMVFLVFGIWIAALVSAYLLGNNPVFLVVYVLFGFGIIIASVIIDVAQNQFFFNENLIEYTINYPITGFFIQNSIIFSVLFVVSMGVALYMKSRVGVWLKK